MSKARKGDYSEISRWVVRMLVERGMTLTSIARTLGVTKSYVSRVNAGTRSLTLNHLVDLERELHMPLPLMFMEATPIESVPRNLRPLYRSIVKLMGGERRPAKRARTGRAKAA
jgi:transcriptional regulator with XRE-family HTH domain